MAGLNPEHLTHLLAEYGPRLLLFASTWTRNASDAVQEVFVELALRTKQPDHLVAWLFGATRKRALHLARGEARLAKREHQASRPESSTDHQQTALEYRLDAETALAILPPDLREIVVARIWGELDFETIGRMTGISAATAWRRHEEALSLLQRRLSAVEKV